MPDSGKDLRRRRKEAAARERAARAERRAQRAERQAARARGAAERQTAGDDIGDAVRDAVDAVRKNLTGPAARVARKELRRLPYQVEVRPRRKRSRRRRELTPEEQALQEARRTAERKIKFVQHLVSYTTVCLALFFIVRPVAWAVAFFWGIGLASHFFQAIIAPDLRRKWVSAEVDRQVARTVSRERRALEGENLRSLEELSASIAHEIRNPITAAKSLVQQLGEDPTSSENVEYAQVALEELDRVERSISHLLRYAREEAMDVREIRLAEVLESALETVKDRIEKQGVVIKREVDSEGLMEGDPEKLRRVLINLVGNALDAFEDVSTDEPSLEIGLGENLAGNEVWVSIKDNGGGMDSETQKKIFRPFYTSKSNGTGLGLAITRKLVDAHKGRIELSSTEGKGTEFVLMFPKQAGAEVVS